MNRFYAAVLIACSIAASAQDKKPVAPITSEEEIAILAAQKERLQASLAVADANKRSSEAQNRLQDLARKVYEDRGIEGTAWSLCDGPQLPECSDVKPGRIALRQIKNKPKDEKKDDKKAEKK